MKNYTKLKMIHTDADLLKPPKMSKAEKEARIIALAEKLNIKVGGKNEDTTRDALRP